MNPRLSVQLPAKYLIPRLGADLRRARTLNMSRSGLLIECIDETAGLVFGDSIHVEIELPAVQTLQSRCIFSTGTIVRIEREGSRERIALSVGFMEFRNAAVAEAVILQQASSFLM
jgi:hypothetical protein